MPFNDSHWFRKDDDVRWQWREATWTTNGSPKGEWSELGNRDMEGKAERPTERARTSQHNQAHQFGSLGRGNANFAWPSLLFSSFIFQTCDSLAPHTALRESAISENKATPQVVSRAKDNVAGFVLADGSMSSDGLTLLWSSLLVS